MAKKSSEEYPCDNTDNFPETAKPSNSAADKNDDDTLGSINVPEIVHLPDPDINEKYLFSFDELKLSELNIFPPKTRLLYMAKIVSDFFDETASGNYTARRDNDNVDVVENDHNNLVEINNEPNLYALDDDNVQPQQLVTLQSSMFMNPSSYESLIMKCGFINFPENALPNYDPSKDEGFFEYGDYTLPPLSSNIISPPLNLDVSVVKHGQEYIDFMSVFTEFEMYRPFLEKVFSYLSYKDIASMTTVSKTWRKSISKSVTAQNKLEKVFIHAILYFCHENINVTDEYKKLYDKILIHFKNQIQFEKRDF
ncbi:putative serine/threonine-protein kinase nek3 [Aphis craccivora]|uniref:Putative serine/threonine-protein kinase nek3 n=1 Tax=Aphis craccivora TaxID=307492 RepID=A0A6G0YYL6_APHCR|nr:putative serine/threonine-protein kinase nek3 [Aphis craccivora]